MAKISAWSMERLACGPSIGSAPTPATCFTPGPLLSWSRAAVAAIARTASFRPVPCIHSARHCANQSTDDRRCDCRVGRRTIPDVTNTYFATRTGLRRRRDHVDRIRPALSQNGYNTVPTLRPTRPTRDCRCDNSVFSRPDRACCSSTGRSGDGVRGGPSTRPCVVVDVVQ
jgi:hypothetical protein